MRYLELFLAALSANQLRLFQRLICLKPLVSIRALCENKGKSKGINPIAKTFAWMEIEKGFIL